MTQIISQQATGDVLSAFGSNTLLSFDGVLGEWWLGDDEASSLPNAITGVNATVIGAPVYHPGYASIGYSGGVSKGFNLDVGAESGAVTLLALLRNPDAAGAPIIAGPSIDPADQASFFNYNLKFGDQTHISMGNGHITGSTDQSIVTVPDATKFTMVQGVGLLNTPSRIYMTTAGGTVMDDGAAVSMPVTRELAPIRLGGLFNVNFHGFFDIAAFALVDGGMGQDYIEGIYPLWKAYAESRGIAVN
jgi:hypothetical protein